MITDEQSIQLSIEHAHAEVDLVATILCDPARGMPVADAAGIQPAMFHHQDLKLIYSTCDVARHIPLPELLVVVRHVLYADNYWFPRGPIGSTGCQWSDETLCSLANRWFPSSFAVERAAKKLLDINARFREVDELQHRIDALCAGDVAPKPITEANELKIVMRPSTRKLKGAA